MEAPLFGLTAIIRDPKELCVSAEKVDVLHATVFLLLVDVDTALSSVALLVCMDSALLKSGRSELVEFRMCEVGA
jgi:hypothetical protein